MAHSVAVALSPARWNYWNTTAHALTLTLFSVSGKFSMIGWKFNTLGHSRDSFLREKTSKYPESILLQSSQKTFN